MIKEKIKSIEEIEGLIAALKKENKKIITTNGVFDILHIGHIRYLNEAKNLGDVLIVALNSDNSVKQIKDPRRPINNENIRAEAIASLSCVDYVLIFPEKTPIDVLSKLKPNIHVKGGDYNLDQLPEKNVIEKNKGKIVLIPEIEGYSTSNLIDKIVELYKS